MNCRGVSVASCVDGVSVASCVGGVSAASCVGGGEERVTAHVSACCSHQQRSERVIFALVGLVEDPHHSGQFLRLEKLNCVVIVIAVT